MRGQFLERELLEEIIDGFIERIFSQYT